MKNNETDRLKKSELQLKKALLRSKKKEQEIEELLYATYSILETNDFEITARKIFDSCARTIGVKAGYVALLSDDGEENELLFLEDGGMPCTVDLNLPMPVRGLRGVAYETGKVAYDNDFMGSEWVKYMPAGHMDLKNVLFAPLNIEGKTVGIMGMACKDGDFDENDARIAAAFGEYAAIALQNSRTVEMLNQKADQLKELNATKDKLYSIIAHDLKNPFNSILGLSESLLQRVDNNEYEDLPKISRALFDASSNGAALLDNLLEWSRSQTGRIQFQPVEFMLKHIVNEVISLLSPFAEKKNVNLDSCCADFVVRADSEMLKTVLRNLVSNAIKFSHIGKTVAIECKKNEDSFCILVKDQGAGMDKEQQEKLFKVGDNVSTPGTENEQGTGLGLILCKEFVDVHQGTIKVESEKDKGSVFEVIIPQDH